MKLGLKHKIIATNLIVLILAFLVIYLIVVERLNSVNENMLVENLKHQADISVVSIKQRLLTGEHPSVSEKEFNAQGMNFAASLSRESEVRVLIFSKEKELLADSENIESEYPQFKELDNVIKGNRTFTIRRAAGARYLHFAFPVMHMGNIIGEVIFVYPMKEIDKITQNTQILFMIAFVVGILLILVVSIVLSSRITKPILQLKESAVEISKGRYANKISLKSSDEVGELARAFNIMSLEIENRINIINFEKDRQRQFFTNVSHELKTPLTTILGYTELLKSKGNNPEIFDTSVNYLQDAGERLSRLVNDLIDLSCLSKFEFEMEPKNTDISKLVRDIVGQMSLKAQKFNIKVNADIPELPDILVDPARIKQVVVNVLDNAIKYSPGGTINVSLSAEEKSIRLDITDTGCGIPEDMLEKIFEPFYRVDKARTRAQGGNGLGLAITREILQKHNGDISIESKEGQGTKVRITLLR